MAISPQKLNNKNTEQNLRTLWREVKHITTQTRRTGQAPGATDDNKQGFDVGAIWVDTSTDTPYICVDNSTALAIWLDLTTGSPTTVPTTDILDSGVATAVPASTQTTVLSYTATANTKLTNIICGGIDNAKWQVYIDSVLKITQRAANGDRNLHIPFTTPLLLANGSTIDVKVTHTFAGDVLDFESTLLGYV